MMIDEVRLRQVLGDADQMAPPSAVNLAEALAAGRRKLRRLRIFWATGSALAAIAVTVAAVPVANWLHYPAKPVAGPAAGRGPRAFNPLVQYAYFARLPSGARDVGVSISPAEVTQRVAEGTRLVLTLTATTRGSCRLGGLMRYVNSPNPTKPPVPAQARLSIQCPSQPAAPIPVIAAAPKIGGSDAYWIKELINSGDYGLAWQYAAKAWAFVIAYQMTGPRHAVQPPAERLTPALKQRLRALAEDARFGGTTPLRVPFRLVKLPAGWGAQLADIAYLPIGVDPESDLRLGPTHGALTGQPSVTISWYQRGFRLTGAGASRPAASYPRGRRVRLPGGLTGWLTVPPKWGGGRYQDLLVLHAHGLPFLIIDFNLGSARSAGAAARPTAFEFRTAVGIFKDLRFPPGGTTHPLG